MDISIQKLTAFVKAAEFGSFTKAAELLHYSQSGISRMIADLETDWGTALLERSKAGVRLTSDGLCLLQYAKNVCEASDRLIERIDELNGLRSGMIRIGTFSSVATHWLPNIISKFQKDYPGIDYELLLGDYSEIEEWIANGRVDCGFLRLPTTPDFETTFLKRDELRIILPKSHPLADVEIFPIESICDYPFILLEHGSKTEVSELFERFSISPRVHFTTWDDYAIMSMVESGLGISILPSLILQRIPYDIVSKKLSVPAYRDIALTLKDKKTASLAVKRFIDYIDIL
ncbi:MAG: LysR family transcriptional regulator [Clostridiales bacterium]|nr:LysR family transcriptional regulator [Clostridiales bacterium]